MDLWSKKVLGIITQVTLILFGSCWVTRGGKNCKIHILGESTDVMLCLCLVYINFKCFLPQEKV